MISAQAVADAQVLARKARAHAVRMVSRSKASHIGTCLSMADMLGVLYGAGVLRVRPNEPHWPDRDRFILSKGHGAAILYAILAERGFISTDELNSYCAPGSRLLGHANHHVPGIELSTGSLGHGLPVACGLALAAIRGGDPYRVYVILSDGELDEGSNWEAILFAAHHKLHNLTVLVDWNKIQSFGRVSEVLNLDPLPAKWEAFGWNVREVNGHNYEELIEALQGQPDAEARPTVLLCNTTKGKGVSFMEDQLAWHYKSPNEEQLRQALAELEPGQ
jgi:transketolase